MRYMRLVSDGSFCSDALLILTRLGNIFSLVRREAALSKLWRMYEIDEHSMGFGWHAHKYVSVPVAIISGHDSAVHSTVSMAY